MTSSPIARPGLLRVLGGAFGLAMVVGATIGAGILGSPGDIAKALPNSALFMAVWVFGGVNALLGATVYAELGAMIPRSGGTYVFARRAFGDGAGFVVGYGDWVNWALGPTVLLLLAGDYISAIVPPLAGHPLVAGGGAFAILAALQWKGVRTSGRVQEIATLLKALLLVALVVAAYTLPHAQLAPSTVAPPAMPRGWALVLAIGVAMQGVIFTYDSYYAVVYCGEEITNPGRTIPRSIFRGLWIIIAIYLMLNAAFLHVVPVERVAGDSFVGGTVAHLIFGSRGDELIRIVMIVAILGTANALMMGTPRILVAMARDGLFPMQATHVNAGGTPTTALACSLALIAAFLATGSFTAVLGVDAFFIALSYVVTFASLFKLRHTEPDTPRPYRAWGYPYVPALAIALALMLLGVMSLGDHSGALITAAVMLASWPAWHIARRLMRRQDAPRS